jgi:large subunit ribosomal protein L30
LRRLEIVPVEKKLRITLVKGLTSKRQDHRATVRGLGLKWRSDTVEIVDTPQVRGMINKVAYMLKVTDGQDSGR